MPSGCAGCAGCLDCFRGQNAIERVRGVAAGKGNVGHRAVQEGAQWLPSVADAVGEEALRWKGCLHLCGIVLEYGDGMGSVVRMATKQSLTDELWADAGWRNVFLPKRHLDRDSL